MAKNLTNKIIAITGAGSGIGRELALQLAQKGAILALNDFNSATLSETAQLVEKAGGTCTQHPFDVSQQAAFEQFATDILEQHGRVDGLINNAGVALGKIKVLEVSMEEIEWIFNINLWGVIYGTKIFVPHLLKQPNAVLVNISSVFGIMGVPTQAPYCMTKFAVRGLTESLRMELWNKDIHIMQVHPGGIDTNIVQNSRDRSEEAKQRLAKSFKRNARTSAKDAARQIIEGMEKGKKRVLIGRDAKIIDILTRLFPTSYQNYLGKFIKKKKA